MMPSTEVIVKLGDIEPFKKLLAGLVELHSPEDEEAEIWIDGPGSKTHAEHWPDCVDCDGHTLTIQVCSECGYEHDGDMAVYRPWPCPTLKLVQAVIDV